MRDTHRHRPEAAPPVTQWDFDRLSGQIHARDGTGQSLMTICTDPWFGPRLAAAFWTPPEGHRPPPAIPLAWQPHR